MEVYLVPVGAATARALLRSAGRARGGVGGRRPAEAEPLPPVARSVSRDARRSRARSPSAVGGAGRSRVAGAGQSADHALGRREHRRAAAALASAPSNATLVSIYPDDLSQAEALQAMVARSSSATSTSTASGSIIDGLLFIASGLLMLVPGPNILAYYFAFRRRRALSVVAGRASGLSGIEWTPEQSAALSELRRAIDLAPDAREQRVHEVARPAAARAPRQFLPTVGHPDVVRYCRHLETAGDRRATRVPPRWGRRRSTFTASRGIEDAGPGRPDLLHQPQVRAGAAHDACIGGDSRRGRGSRAVRDAARVAALPRVRQGGRALRGSVAARRPACIASRASTRAWPLGDGASIGPFAVIGDGARIGARTIIHPHVDNRAGTSRSATTA